MWCSIAKCLSCLSVCKQIQILNFFVPAPSGPPSNVTAIPLDSKSILVRWEPPLPALQNGAILGYRITCSLQSPDLHPIGNSSSSSLVAFDEKWSQQAEVKGLKPNAHYRIAVKAYNAAGIGPESPFITVYTPEGGENKLFLNRGRDMHTNMP